MRTELQSLLKYNPGSPEGYASEETTHYSVVDAMGNAVSATTTLNNTFGSSIVVDSAGFLLNNQMDDFSVKPGFPEYVRTCWRGNKFCIIREKEC